MKNKGKTTTLYFEGVEAQWAKLQEDNLDDFGGKLKSCIDVFLTADQWDRLKESGSMIRPKLQPDGRYLTKFKRNFEHSIPELGGLPVVVDADGKPFTNLIGNGSTVSVIVEVYPTTMGPGTRLNKIRVDTLVEYTKSIASNGILNKDVPF
jgi:hypothetical protein